MLPITLANQFLIRAGKTGLTHMQLQKLTYLTHEKWLKAGHGPMLSQNPEVWQFGPVFSDMYHTLKHHKNDRITAIPEGRIESDVKFNEAMTAVIDEIWREHGSSSGPYLSGLTHRKGTPWRNIAERHKFKVPYGTEITPQDIHVPF